MKRTVRKFHKNFNVTLPILSVIALACLTITSSHYEKSWSFNWNEIRTQVKDSVIATKNSGTITTGPIGYRGSNAENEIKRQKWIIKTATEKELLLLTNYPHGGIKAIAYEGLLRNNQFKPKTELTIKAIKDTTYKVRHISGCFIENSLIGEHLVKNVLQIDKNSPPLPYGIENSFIKENKIDTSQILLEYRKLLKNHKY